METNDCCNFLMFLFSFNLVHYETSCYLPPLCKLRVHEEIKRYLYAHYTLSLKNWFSALVEYTVYC